MIDQMLLDNETLQSLNKKERVILDDNKSEVREEILWYLSKINHYHHQMFHPVPTFQHLMDPITIEQAKFQYTFWFEAMLWYIRNVIKRKESEQQKAIEKAKKK